MRENPELFLAKKQEYFTRLGLRMREALKLHKKAGLWDRKTNGGEREWGNVTEHCLVEVARIDVFKDKLGLPNDLASDLSTAAALHDFFKKGEKEIVVSEGLNWDSFEHASQESIRQMQAAGFNERTVNLAHSSGHDSLFETEEILGKKDEELTPEDVAYLIMHYVDDYTIGDDWATEAETTLGDNKVNDFDRRMDKNETNERYAKLNEEGRTKFSGETTFEAQRRIGHLVEAKLATLLSNKIGQTINAKDLPTFVDVEIRSKIAAL